MGSLLDLARATPGLARKAEDAELDRLLRYVAEHYGCPPHEVVLMRECATRDWEAALESLRAMAGAIGHLAPN